MAIGEENLCKTSPSIDDVRYSSLTKWMRGTEVHSAPAEQATLLGSLMQALARGAGDDHFYDVSIIVVSMGLSHLTV